MVLQCKFPFLCFKDSASETSNDEECPPGVWTCKKKRDRIVGPPGSQQQTGAVAKCDLPGLWTCKRDKLWKSLKASSVQSS